MIDEDLKVYLIEVNKNPCLSTLSLNQHSLVSKLLEDTFKLTIDPIFCTQTKVEIANSNEKVTNKGEIEMEDDGYLTRFELIYSIQLPRCDEE